MKVYKIWDVVKKVYRSRYGQKTANQSCWDDKSTASRVAGRLSGKGMYEIHEFHLQKVEE